VRFQQRLDLLALHLVMEINNKFDLVDIGANLTSRQLSQELNRVLSEAQQQNVSTIIITGSQRQLLRLCCEFHFIAYYHCFF
jgi:Tat protein secretion system quality control protein TatD with DNase activity